MAPQSRDWTIPAPVRTLLWWPGISFALVIVAPEAAVGTIIAAGALLAVLGAFVSVAAQRLREQRIAARQTGNLAVDPPTTEFPTIEITPTAVRRAA